MWTNSIVELMTNDHQRWFEVAADAVRDRRWWSGCLTPTERAAGAPLDDRSTADDRSASLDDREMPTARTGVRSP
jgi:hypothetical protein